MQAYWRFRDGKHPSVPEFRSPMLSRVVGIFGGEHRSWVSIAARFSRQGDLLGVGIALLGRYDGLGGSLPSPRNLYRASALDRGGNPGTCCGREKSILLSQLDVRGSGWPSGDIDPVCLGDPGYGSATPSQAKAANVPYRGAPRRLARSAPVNRKRRFDLGLPRMTVSLQPVLPTAREPCRTVDESHHGIGLRVVAPKLASLRVNVLGEES